MVTPSQLEALRYGRDLALPDAGVRLTPSGDWPTREGRPNVTAAVLERAETTPGELTHRPDYGAGVERFVEAIASPAKRAELVVALRDNLSRDPRLAEVSARIAAPAGGASVVTLLVRLRGNDDPDRIEFTLE